MSYKRYECNLMASDPQQRARVQKFISFAQALVNATDLAARRFKNMPLKD